MYEPFSALSSFTLLLYLVVSFLLSEWLIPPLCSLLIIYHLFQNFTIWLLFLSPALSTFSLPRGHSHIHM